MQIPVSGGTPGTPAIFVNSINGADGLVIDSDDNLWVAANQSDEIVVVDKTGKVIAKLGDFEGLVNDGTPKGLLFPASPAFSRDGKTLYVTNLALDLRVRRRPTQRSIQPGRLRSSTGPCPRSTRNSRLCRTSNLRSSRGLVLHLVQRRSRQASKLEIE